MSIDTPAPDTSTEPSPPSSPQDLPKRPRVRRNALIVIGLLGLLAVGAEFLVPRLILLSQVENLAKNDPGTPTPPNPKDFPWTTQTLSLIAPTDGSPLVAVLSRPTRPVHCQPFPNAQSALAHELARQALLFTLRENLGVRTCDLALGASPPEGKTRAEVTVRTLCRDSNTGFSIEFEQDGEKLVETDFELETSSPEQPAYNQPLPTVPPFLRGHAFPYADLDRQVVEQAQGPWIKALQPLGLKPRPAASKAPSEPLDRSLTDALNTWTFTEPFDAVERLHAEAASKGLSPARLSGLSLGYAQLGYQSAHLWSPIHDILSARGLIYAQRLIDLDPKSPVGLWNRAHVLALTGLHQSALDDLKAAQKCLEALPEADRPEPPRWVETIDAFCRFDDARLDTIARTGSAAERTRARVLGAWTAFDPMLLQDHASQAAQAAIRAAPECYRLYSDYYDTSRDVGDGHRSTGLPLALFSARVRARLMGLTSLPEPVRPVLETSKDETAIVQALEQTERDRPSAVELPWTVLARWMRDERFLQVLHRTEFMTRRWSVPVDDFIEQYGSLVQDHPFRLAIDSLYRQPDPKVIEQFHCDDPRSIERPVFLLIGQARGKPQSELYELAYACLDDTYDELVRMARVPSEGGKLLMGVRLIPISPYAPVGPTTMIENRAIKPEQAEEWLVTHAQHPMVISQLALLFEGQKDLENASKAFEIVIKNSHETLAYEKLAAIYKAQGRRDDWKRTLDEALENTPNQGLKHARMQVEIARDLMSRGHAEEARPYADAAAETWAEWAMRCAVDCHQRLEEWDQADLWMGRISQRYSNRFTEWYFWCLETGHGNVVDAQTLVVDTLSAIDMTRAGDEMRGLAVYLYTLAHENRKALQTLDIDFPKPGLYLQGLYYGLAADELGDADAREHGWKDIPEGDEAVSGIAKLFLDTVADGETAPLDLDAVDAVLEKASGKRQSDLCYFIGRFLQRHGHRDDANRYLERIQTNSSALSHMRRAALCALREGA